MAWVEAARSVTGHSRGHERPRDSKMVLSTLPRRPSDVDTVSRPMNHHRHHHPVDHHGGIIFFGQILLVTVAPWLDEGHRHTPATMFAAAIATSALTVFFLGHRRPALLMAVLCLGAMVGMLLGGDRFEIRLPGMLVLAAAYAYAAWLCVRSAFSTDIVAKQRILCGAAGYVMLGFIFAVFHILLGIWHEVSYMLPADVGGGRSARWIDYLWLSFSTLTTAGFGDLVPVDPWANMLCTLEAMAGVLFPATLIARIASLPSDLHSRRSAA